MREKRVDVPGRFAVENKYFLDSPDFLATSNLRRARGVGRLDRESFLGEQVMANLERAWMAELRVEFGAVESGLLGGDGVLARRVYGVL